MREVVDSGYILKLQSTGIPDETECGGKKEDSRMTTKVWRKYIRQRKLRGVGILYFCFYLVFFQCKSMVNIVVYGHAAKEHDMSRFIRHPSGSVIVWDC